MRFDPPIEEPLHDGFTLIVHSACLDKRDLVHASVQIFNGTVVHADSLRLGQRSARQRFTKALLNHAAIDGSVVDMALLKLNANLEPMLIGAPPDNSRSPIPSQATQLVELAHDAELFHTPDGEVYATIQVGDHKETWLVKKKSFRRFLMRKYYEQTNTSPNSQALQDALGVLEGKGLFDGPEHEVHTRVAEVNGTIYLDLANSKWEVVEITPEGWRVVADPPMKFRRARGMEPLPYPVEGGTLGELRPFVNVSDDDWALVLGWLVQAISPRGPYPILVIHGEQGSAKSTTERVLRLLVDPNQAPIRNQPRDEHDLIVAATNSWIIALDNMSRLPQWLSDAFCRLATGGGSATRELYSDQDEVLFDGQRPIIINGIEELATSGDLLDRSIILYLPRIPDETRELESEFWPNFEQARGRILGALLTAVSAAMRNVHQVNLPRLPRMADFAQWAVGAETEMGLQEGTFIRAYTRNRQAANSLVLESTAVSAEVWKLIESRGRWLGNATELLNKLNSKLGDSRRLDQERQGTWPKNGRALSNVLRRLAPNLRAVGVEITFKKKNRRILIEQGSNFASPSSTPRR